MPKGGGTSGETSEGSPETGRKEKKEQEDILSSAGDAARKAERELAAAEAELKSLSDSVEFASREEAQRQKQEAESGKDRAREAYEKAEKEAEELKKKNAGDRDSDRRIPGGTCPAWRKNLRKKPRSIRPK